MPTYVVLDFETASSCDLKAAGAWRYAEDPTTEVICLCWATQPHNATGMWVPDQHGSALFELAGREDVHFIAHNSAFEKAIWRHIMVPVYGFPDIPNDRWHCTLASAAMHALPQQLDKLALVLNIPRRSDSKAKRARVVSLSRANKKTGAYNRSVEALADVYADCRMDVEEEVNVCKAIGLVTATERAVWLLDQTINERGVRLDLEYVSACERLVERASVPLEWEFRQLTKDFIQNPKSKDIVWGLSTGQGARIIEWAKAHGADIPDLTKETVDRMLGVHEEDDYESLAEPDNRPATSAVLPPMVRRALEIRRVLGSSSIKKLPRMRACVSSDGRARGLLQYHGTMPGRKAGRLFQPQNFPRPTIDDPDPALVVAAIQSGDPGLVEAMLGPPINVVVSGLRHCIIADRGRVLASGDYAGIQARIVLALARQYDKLALMASGADVYCDMAEKIYKRPINKKNDPKERQTGKNSVLGLGFQMGWRKFQLKYAKDESDDFCQLVVNTYRDDWAPQVPELWRALGDAAFLTVQTGQPHEAAGIRYTLKNIGPYRWLTARLPSGRLLWYFNPEIVKRAMPWDPLDIRPGWTYQAQKNGVWRTIHAFGGLLTENVVMGIERDIMTHGAELLEANGFPIVLDVHDELLCEPLKSECDLSAMEQIMCDIEPWAKELKLPIAIEAWAGDRYRK